MRLTRRAYQGTFDVLGLDAATRCAAEALARRFGTGAIEARMRAFVIRADSRP